MKKWVVFSMLIGIIIMLPGCGQLSVVTKSEFALDTVITLTVYGETDSTILDQPIQTLRKLDEQLSAYNEKSEIYQINLAAGDHPVTVSKETFGLIEKGLAYSKLSEGKFDITIGPLIDLWGIEAPGEGKVPTQAAINQALALVDYTQVQLNAEDLTVYLPQKGMEINLGSIAKGYIGDVLKNEMKASGIDHAVLNLGGNVVLIGGKTDHEDFSVGVENPLDPDEDPIGSLEVANKAVVSSGDYERYFEADGVRYCHILDPETGYPADAGVHQTTIIANASVDADALSTIAFLCGPEKMATILDQEEGIDAIYVTTDNQIIVPTDLKNTFQFNTQKYGETFALVYQ